MIAGLILTAIVSMIIGAVGAAAWIAHLQNKHGGPHF